MAAFCPTHRHKRRGGDYEVVAIGALQCATPAPDITEVTIYRDEAGRWWVRPTAEFNDGRFEAVIAPSGEA